MLYNVATGSIIKCPPPQKEKKTDEDWLDSVYDTFYKERFIFKQYIHKKHECFDMKICKCRDEII